LILLGVKSQFVKNVVLRLIGKSAGTVKLVIVTMIAVKILVAVLILILTLNVTSVTEKAAGGLVLAVTVK